MQNQAGEDIAEIALRIAELPADKRELFERLLKKQPATTPRRAAIPRRRDSSRALLSFAQQRLWFLNQLAPGNPFYNVFDAMRLDIAVDVAALERSLNEIVRRHEVLRTSFVAVNGQPMQVIAPHLAIPLSVVDLSHLPGVQSQAEVLRLATEEGRRPFDLARGPLLRASLVRLGDWEYVLLLSMHHIVSDGWSMGVFFRELVALYGAFAAGEQSPLPELPIQYADYAVWQRQWLQGSVLDKQVAYWREQLADLPRLELPVDHARPAVASYRGAHELVEFSPEVTAGLKGLCQQEGVTLFMALLAGYAVLLRRYSGQEEVVIGTPIAGRNWRETEGLIGFFVNTLVLRVGLGGEPSFRELLGRIKELTLSAYEHQDVPFERLVEELHPQRDLSRNPLFQVTFQLFQTDRTGEAEGDSGSSGPELRDIQRGTAKFDLTFDMWEGAGGLRGRLEYSTDLFERATIERMAAHFQTLLAGIVADPDRRIWGLPLLSEAERQQLVVEWNATEAEYPRVCVHRLFEAQAARQPEAAAVVCEEEVLSYGELNVRANQLARRLQRLGVGPEVIVGVCLERSVRMVVAVLGVLKAGGAYAPLDPGYPEERLRFMIEDLRAPVVLSETAGAGRLAREGLRVLCLDAEGTELESESGADLDGGAEPQNLAYVIYTSGSTGLPKGVMIEHRSVLNLLASLDQNIYKHLTGSQLRVSLNGPLAFDTSVKQLIQLLNGHVLYVVPEETRLDAEALVAYVRRHKLDVLDCTPSQLRFLLDAGLADGSQPALSLILVGGEPIDALLWGMLARSQSAAFYNLYGPTECTVDATACRVTSSLSTPSIGRPLGNTEAYVLDCHLQPVPVGVPGELFVGGVCLARGYLHRPDLTAERFIPHPFSKRLGACLYRTGDLVRHRRDGQIEFLGRADEQIKLRGFRIEPGEIEAVLAQHAAVRRAVVIAREDTPGHRRLVVYLVPRHGQPWTVPELQNFLRARVPEYMVPSAFVPLQNLPLTRHGKVDHEALPPPDWDEQEGGYVAPRNATEEVLVALWGEVLGIERVGVHEDFFRDLGGHSLLATQLMARIRNALNVDLPLRRIFEAPTVAQMGLAVQQIVIDSPPPSAQSIPRVSREQHLNRVTSEGTLEASHAKGSRGIAAVPTTPSALE